MQGHDERPDAEGGPPGVLVVEGEDRLRRLLQQLLEDRGYRVHTAGTTDEGRRLLRSRSCHVLVLAVGDGGDISRQLVSDATSAEVGVPVVALVDAGAVDSAVDVMRDGAHDCLAKPLGREALLDSVRRAAAGASERSSEPNGSDTSGEIRRRLNFALIGRSEGLEHTLDLVRRVAPTRSAVLVMGETGTGKELVARAVHQLSNRSGAFVPVVCSALPESLLEAELFGHRKGSFTGAHQDRPGLVQDADGGTLFLDEISTVPADVQVKLLRVLEEGEVRRVGGGERARIDFRLVAATNVSLEEEVEAGRFREDLFYRLNVFPIRVPPLRERREDIPLLAEHFRRRFAEENDVDPPKITDETLTRMAAYDWPGNVRELQHFVERAMILYADAPSIRFDPPSRMLPDREERVLERAEREEWDLDRLEREYILRVLEGEEGNRSRAAEILGVHRRTIARKMERYRPPTRPDRNRQT